MKELHSNGYIKYQPSYNPFKGSLVTLIDLTDSLKPQPKRAKTKPNNNQVDEQATEQAVNKLQTSNDTSSGTSTEQALVPSINSINNTNNTNKENLKNFLNLDEQTKKNEIETNFSKKIKEEKSSAKKEENANPNLEQVKAFFNQNSFPEVEAQKFYNYFASNGWLVGGKSPMVNWNASAENWMLNSQKFNPQENQKTNQNYLNATIDKNYAEPL
jgi:hypothetical protein